MSDSKPDLRNHAGPYGFTRREIVVVASIVVISVSVIAFSEWQDRKQQVPAWIIEDVLVEAPPTRKALDSSVAENRDLASTMYARDHSELIDINSADVRTLARLPGIGAELARRIIAERSTNGPFVSLTDLQRVRGIGPRKAAMLSGWIKLSREPEFIKDSVESP
jgi:competence ComEA-like helix-hairpin-helix protein